MSGALIVVQNLFTSSSLYWGCRLEEVNQWRQLLKQVQDCVVSCE